MNFNYFPWGRFLSISIIFFSIIFQPLLVIIYKSICLTGLIQPNRGFSAVAYVLSFLGLLSAFIFASVNIFKRLSIRIVLLILSFPFSFVFATIGFNILLAVWYAVKLPKIDLGAVLLKQGFKQPS